jgi:hypothetical protein
VHNIAMAHPSFFAAIKGRREGKRSVWQNQRGPIDKKYGHLNLHNFAHEVYAKSATSPTGHCARFVHDAMSIAGLKLPLRDAWQYSHAKGSLLTDAGFVQIFPGHYHPLIGDVVIWLPVRGKPVASDPKHLHMSHIYGHIQVYTGRSDHPWVSDFKQRDKSNPGFPGEGWKTNRAVYEIYRYMSWKARRILSRFRT